MRDRSYYKMEDTEKRSIIEIRDENTSKVLFDGRH
jgi:hypothetical protein